MTSGKTGPWVGSPRSGAPDPAAVWRALAWCHCPDALYNFFELDLRRGELTVAGGSASGAFRSFLADNLSASARPAGAGDALQHETLLLGEDGDDLTLVRTGSPQIVSDTVVGRLISVIYGFVTSAAPGPGWGVRDTLALRR